MKGMDTWCFDVAMQCLLLMLQIVLLGCSLPNYLFFIDKGTTGVAIGFATFGLLFYLLVASVATFSYNCPFQTPLSLILRLMIHPDNEHKYLKRTVKWFSLIFSDKSKRAFDGNSLGDHIELQTVDTYPQPSPLFNKEIYWVGYLLDSDYITWMLEVSMDADVIMAIMRFIPEVVLHAGT